MTDRIHSCRQSPNGRHRFTVSPLMCDYCSRTTTYLQDLGWNAPAVDPDVLTPEQDAEYARLSRKHEPELWVDQEADVNDARTPPVVYRVVNTDNFGSDYPDEKFVGGNFYTEEAAQAFADEKNVGDSIYASRYYTVVRMPYELAPGFEP